VIVLPEDFAHADVPSFRASVGDLPVEDSEMELRVLVFAHPTRPSATRSGR
jgi:hypothetical protein